MDKTSLIQILKRMADDAALVKAVIEKETSTARILVDEETKHEVEDWLLIIGNDVATSESMWSQFGRMTVSSKRFTVNKK